MRSRSAAWESWEAHLEATRAGPERAPERVVTDLADKLEANRRRNAPERTGKLREGLRVA